MFELQYIGHAGWLIKNNNLKVLCDPWFSPDGAFLSSWFPFPNNNHLFASDLLFDLDFIYISHAHEDHFDKWTLKHADRKTPILIPRFKDKTLLTELKKMNFDNIKEMCRADSHHIKGIDIKIIEDEGFFDNDSCIMLDDGQDRVLNLNDCHIDFQDLKNLVGDIDLLLLQSSSAIWWPCAYDYDSKTMKKNCKTKKNNILKRTLQYSKVLNAKNVIPNAGPPIFIDDKNEYWNHNRRQHNPFVMMDDSVEYLNKNDIQSHLVIPGSTVNLSKSLISLEVNHKQVSQIYDNYDHYLTSYKSYIKNRISTPSATHKETLQLIPKFAAQIKTLKKISKFYVDKIKFPILFDFKDLGKWVVDFSKEECFFKYTDESYNYSFVFEPDKVCLLFRDDSVDFEKYFLSLNFSCHREQDEYNEYLFALLKNFDTKRFMLSEQIYAQETNALDETYELVCKNGNKLDIKRYCPHKMVDLKKNGFINEDNELVCPLHAWRFSLQTGECVNHSGQNNIFKK